MKYLITGLFLMMFIVGKSQSSLLVDGRLNIDSMYQNKDELLIQNGILVFDGLKKEELKTKVKNWGSTTFVNLKEILVSDTEDQMVLNYIDNSFYVKSLGMKIPWSWYIRLVIQFKDGKIRYSFYDDGNTFEPSSQYAPSISPRTYHLIRYFKADDNITISQKTATDGLVHLKESILKTQQSLQASIEKKDSEKKDW